MNAQAPSGQLNLGTIAAGIALLGALIISVLSPIFAWQWTQQPFFLGAFPAQDLLVDFLVPYAIALCYLAVGTWVLWQRSRDNVAGAFAVACAGVSTLLAAWFDTGTSHILTHAWIAGWSVAGVGLLCFSSALLQERRSAGRAKWCLWLAIPLGLAIALWTEALASSNELSLDSRSGLPSYAFVSCATLVMLGSLLCLRLRPSELRVRIQAQLILVSTLISVLPLAVWIASRTPLLLRSDWGFHYPFHPLSHLPLLALFPAAVAYVLCRYEALGLDLLFGPTHGKPSSYGSALHELGQELAACVDPDEITDQLLARVGDLLQPKQASVYVTSAQSGDYELRGTWGEVGTEPAVPSLLTSQDQVIAKLHHAQCLSLSRQALGELGLEQDERARLEGLEAVLLVPLCTQDRLMGVLALGPLRSGDEYGDDKIPLLCALADQTALAIERAMLYTRQLEQERRLVEQTRQLTNILALGNQLKSLDRETVLQETVQAIHQGQGFGLVTLSLVEENDPTRVRIVAWAGLESTTWERVASRSLPLFDPEAVSGVHELGNCYFVCAPGTSADISTSKRDVPWHEGDQLYVPLTGNEGLLGYLTVDRPEENRRPTEDQLEVLEIFANQAAIAIQNAELYASIDRALDERVAELATLHEIDRQINRKLDFDHVMGTTLEWAMSLTSAVAGTLALVSEDQQSLRVVAHRGYPPEIEKYWDGPWPVQEGVIGRVVRTAEPVIIEDVTRDANYVDVTSSTRSHLAAPITREDQVIGVISLESNEPSGFTADHLAFLARLADHAAIAIENARLYEETSQRVAELSTLQKISLDLTSHLDLGAVLDSIAVHTRELTRADQVSIYLYDEHRDALAFGAGLSYQGKGSEPPIPIEENQITKEVVRQGMPAFVHNTREHPLLSNVRQHLGAVASIPIQKANHTLGALEIAFERTHFYTTDEMRVLGLLADQAAIAIENAQFYADARRANEAKSRFVRVVSDELRTPMTSIQGYAELLTLDAGGPLTEPQREFAEVILRNVERMDRYVDNLLELSRVESGRIELSPRPTQLAAVVRDALEWVNREVETHGIDISVDIPDLLPEVHVDPARIRQAWVNLLAHTCHITSDGGQIKVWAQPHGSAQARSEGGQWVLCAVQAQAYKLATEALNGPLQAFDRANETAILTEHANGLDLSIARGIIELHGGHTWVDTALDSVGAFCFTLPGSSPSTGHSD